MLGHRLVQSFKAAHLLNPIFLLNNFREVRFDFKKMSAWDLALNHGKVFSFHSVCLHSQELFTVYSVEVQFTRVYCPYWCSLWFFQAVLTFLWRLNHTLWKLLVRHCLWSGVLLFLNERSHQLSFWGCLFLPPPNVCVATSCECSPRSQRGASVMQSCLWVSRATWSWSWSLGSKLHVTPLCSEQLSWALFPFSLSVFSVLRCL